MTANTTWIEAIISNIPASRKRARMVSVARLSGLRQLARNRDNREGYKALIAELEAMDLSFDDRHIVGLSRGAVQIPAKQRIAFLDALDAAGIAYECGRTAKGTPTGTLTMLPTT